MFNITKKSSLKKLLMVVICLVAGLMVSGIFAWQTQQFNNKENLIVSVSQNQETDNSFLKFSWGDNQDQNGGIQLINSSNSHGSMSGGYQITLSGKIATSTNALPAGTQIRVSGSESTWYIKFGNSSDDDSEGIATITLGGGYSLGYIYFGPSAGEGNKTYSHNGTRFEQTTSSYITTENIDPNYTGNLYIGVKPTEISYRVNFYYKKADRTYDLTTCSYGTYTVKSSLAASSVKKGETAVKWLYNATDGGAPVSGTATVASTVKINVTGSAITKGGKSYYEISSIGGNNSYGEFTSACFNGGNPIIIADEVYTYDLTITNGNSQTSGNSVWTSDDLRGVKAASSGLKSSTSTSMTMVISRNTTTSEKFNGFSGTSFTKRSGLSVSAEDTKRYVVFNYGYYITGYYVSYTVGSTTQNLSYSSGNWSKVDSATSISIANLTSATFASLATYLDQNVLTGIASISVTPSWAATTVKVTGTNDSQAQEFAYKGTYSLTAASASTGQTFFRYKDENENHIADSGTWEYTCLTGYTGTSSVYTINVTASYFDDLYKVSLTGATTVKSDSYYGDYSAKTTDYTADNYSYSNIEIEPTLGSGETYDNHSAELTAYYNGYSDGVIGSDLYRKIFGSSGSVYTYLWHNHAVGELPTFTHTNKQEILWGGNDGRYYAAAYTSSFSAEIGTIAPDDKWFYSSGMTLTAVYAYSLDAYYENTSSTYSSVKSDLFAANTTLENLPASTSLPNVTSKTFTDWMVDGGAAEAEGYTVTDNSTNKTVTISVVEGLSIQFKYTRKSSQGNYFFGVSHIVGTGELTQSSTSPIVLARFGKSYGTTVNSSVSYWKDAKIDDEASLYGIMYNGTQSNSITISISSSSTSTNYKFQNSPGLAFTKSAGYQANGVFENLEGYISDENYYYVYNYGYVLSGWKISCSNGDYITYNGSSWNFEATSNDYSTASNIDDISFNDLAYILDEKYPTATGNLTLTLTPVWTKATFTVTGTAATTAPTLTFASPYILTEATADDGQSFFRYQTTENPKCFINNDGDNSKPWDYTNPTYTYSSGAYSLAVEPVYLNNVYKVDLAGTSSGPDLLGGGWEPSADITEDVLTFNEIETLGGDVLDLTECENGDEISLELVAFETAYTALLSSSSTIHNKFFEDGDGYYIYLVHNGGVPQLPTFANDYQKEILWEAENTDSTLGAKKRFIAYGFDADGDDETEIFTNETTVGEIQTHSTVWNYSDGLTLNPIYAFRVDLYYENDSASYSSIKSDWFASKTVATFADLTDAYLEGLGADAMAQDKTFQYWMINKTSATNGSYTVTDGTSTTSIVNDDASSETLTLTYNTGLTPTDSFTFDVTDIKGTATLTQESTAPIILARFTRNYDLTVDASASDWDSYASLVTEEELHGAKSNDETDDDGVVTLTVSDSDASAYPFQTSEQTNGTDVVGIAFYKRGDFTAEGFIENFLNSKVDTNNYYYIYNYGYEITGWVIKIDLLVAQETKYLSYSSGWSDGASSSIITATNVSSQTFRDIASFLDVQYMTELGGIDITIYPQWSGVEIGTIYGTVKYMDSYTDVSTDTYSLSGYTEYDYQEFYCYQETETKQCIVSNGVWNYLNFNYEYSNQDYSIGLDPIYLNNLHQVEFVNTSKDLEIELSGNYSESNDNFTDATITWEDLVDDEYLEDATKTTTGLYDSLSSGLASFISGYKSAVSSSAPMYHKVFNGSTNKYTYLLHDDTVNSLPVFEYTYQKEVLWVTTNDKRFESAAMTTDYQAEKLLNGDGEDKSATQWVYSDGLTLTPIYIYKLDLYYENDSSTCSSIREGWYGRYTSMTLPTEEEFNQEDIPEDYNFLGWMIDGSALSNYTSYEGTEIATSEIETDDYEIVKEGVFGVTFTYKEKSKYHENLYYGVTEVIGQGVLTHYATNPIVLARFGKVYNLVLDNDTPNTYWETNDTTNSNLYGAFASADTDEDFKTAQFEVKNHESAAYPFLTSEQQDEEDNYFSLAFYKGSEYSKESVNSKLADESAYYYLYNYGHLLTGWYIECSGTYFYDFVNANTAWSYDTTKSDIVINLSASLTSATFKTVAAEMDDYFATETGDFTITIEPVWTAATVYVENNDSNVVSGSTDYVTYASSYTLTTPDSIDGKTFYRYEVKNEGKIVETSSTWNYTVISKDKYSYNYSTDTFTVDVAPVYFNNIYRVELENTSVDVELLDDGSYELYSGLEANTICAASNYIYDNLAGIGGDDFRSPSETLKDSLLQYLTDFADYYNDFIVGESEVNKKILKTDSCYYIYLVHSHEVGTLPVFTYSHQKEVLWKTASNDKRYETNEYDEDVFSNEAEDDSDENRIETTWNYADGFTLTPIYVYAIDLYFENSENTYENLRREWYGSKTKLSFTSDEPTSVPAGYEFNGWMINGDNAETYSFTLDTTTGNILGVTATSLDVEFDYSGRGVVNNNLFYNVTSIIGTGVVDHNADAPFVLARYKKLYDLVIDNDQSNTYWETNGVNDPELYGAFASAEKEQDSDAYKTATIEVSDQDESAYPFLTSEQDVGGNIFGLAFYKNTDYKIDVVNSKLPDESQYYYVYNYGHHITRWIITCYGESSRVWVDAYNSATKTFAYQTSAVYNTVADLTTATFKEVAAAMDEYFADETGDFTIEIIPDWTAVSIYVKNEGTSVVKDESYVTFASSYELTPAISDYGQTFFAYKDVEDGKFIPNDETWNFTMLRKELFAYASNCYTIDVEPHYFNNMYKVTFNNTNATNVDVENNGDYPSSTGSFTETYYDYTDVGTLGGEAFVIPSNNVIRDEVVVYLTEFAPYYDAFIVGESLIYRKLFKDGSTYHIYLIHSPEELEVGNLPVFKYSHQQEVLWKTSTDKRYVTSVYTEADFGNEATDDSGTDKTAKNWEYEDGFTLTPIYVYAIDLYFEDGEETSAIYSSLRKEWYGAKTSLAFDYKKADQPTSHPYGYVFTDWMINGDTAEDIYNYNLNNDSVNKQLKISSDNFELTFVYGRIGLYNNTNLYYTVTSIIGTGVLAQDILSATGEYQPVMLARYGKMYDLVLDNEDNTYWENNDVEDEDLGLYGAGASSDSDESFKTAKIKVANKEEYAYQFQTNQQIVEGSPVGLAFYKQVDYTDSFCKTYMNSRVDAGADGIKYYYIYNYGYYITEWTINVKGITFEYTGTASYDIEKWTPSSTGTILSNDPADLYNTVTFQKIAELMDEYFVTLTGEITITIYPTWNPVNLDVVLDDGTSLVSDLDYAEGYTLNWGSSLIDPPENTIVAFEYDQTKESDDDFIAIKATWNYYNGNGADPDISKQYVYLSSSGDGDGTYSLTVYPVYIDNIFKVKLSNAIKDEPNTYKLINTDYSFNESHGSYLQTNTNVLTIENTLDGYTTFETSGKTLVDEYIVNLKSYKATYVEQIGNGKLPILRKVYYNLEEAQASEKVLTYSGTKELTFWTYLANNQSTGKLPMFENDYNIHILWQNRYHKDGSECSNIDECSVIGQHYVYMVGPHDEDYHEELKEGIFLMRDKDMDNIPDDWWTYKDGHKSDNSREVELRAKYYRSFYYLDVQTLVETDIERRGYVKVDVVDNIHAIDNTIPNRSGNYIVIAKYDNVSKKMIMEINKYTGSGSIIELTLEKKANQEIRIYNGSSVSINIYDQSQDADAMNSGSYDDMIGYKYSGTVTPEISGIHKDSGNTKEENFTLGRFDGYGYDVDIENNVDYKSKATIKFYVPFEKISYNLKVKMDNIKSGEFNVKTNSINSGYKTSLSLSDIKVGNFYELSYFAFAGYKLQSNAFVYSSALKNDEDAILTYDDSTNIAQNYVLTENYNSENNLDGTWLREHFYNGTYPVDSTNLGEIEICTDVITFNFYLAIYDETDTRPEVTATRGIIENVSEGTFALTLETGVGSLSPIGDYLTDSDLFGVHYHSDTLGNYAVLSSRLLVPNNPTSTVDNYYTPYEFLLSEKPTQALVLNSGNLALMVNNYEDGKIISAAHNNRSIAILLEVRKIYTITMQVLAQDADTNDTVRNVTLTNSTNNSESIIINPEAQTSGGYYYVEDTNNTTVSAYTYHGAENNLSAIYDSSRYTGFIYFIGDNANAESSNTFSVASNVIITIGFIANVLDVEYVYILEGSEVSETTAYEYIDELRPNVGEAGLKVGDSIQYEVGVTKEDYDLRVSINGSIMGSTNKDTVLIECNYTVGNLDFSLNSVRIVVEINQRNNAIITINYTLIDSSKKDADDAYGTFDVYVDEELKHENVETIEMEVYEGRNVSVKLNLSKGYHYLGIRKDTLSIVNTEADEDGKIMMVDDFSTSGDYGNYVIVIDKDILTATLDTSSVKNNAFKAFINGKKVLNDLYVGSVVNFTHTEVNKERLDAFFVNYKDGSTEDIVATEETISLKITSSLLTLVDDTTIVFGIRTINRYKLVTTVVGQEYLEENVEVVYCSNGEKYVNGYYCDEGTQLTFSAKPIGSSEGIFKYNVSFNGETRDIVNKNDFVITLDQDYNYEIRISPKVYNVTVNENLYKDISQIKNNTPESVTTGQVNNMNILGQTSYNSKTILEFVRVAKKPNGQKDRELSAIYISNNDSEAQIVIEFKGTTYVAKVDGETIDLAEYGYSISFAQNNNTVKLTYTTYNNISITVNYKAYKSISCD